MYLPHFVKGGTSIQREPVGSTGDKLHALKNLNATLERRLSLAAASGWVPSSYELHVEQERLEDHQLFSLKVILSAHLIPTETAIAASSNTGKMRGVSLAASPEDLT